MIRMNVFNIRIHKNVRVNFNCVLCCFKNRYLLTHSNFSWWRRRIKIIPLAKKEELANFVSNIKRNMATKKKLKNVVIEKRKFVNSSTNTMGFILKVVREMYPSLSNESAKNNEFKNPRSKKMLTVVYQYQP